jgi:type I restriction enzyme S subunit
MAGEIAEIDEQSWLYRPSFSDEWERMPLLSMARWVNGLAFRDFQFSDTGKPVIKIAEIKAGITGQTKFTNQTFDDSVFVTNGDMLFSWSGQPETSIDVFWWRGREGWLNQHIFKVTPIEDLDPVFFFYVLRYLKPNFIGIARNKQTTGLGHVTRRDIENIEAAFPPLAEQKAIAAVLGALDDKIELNRRMNATLEAMARALFQSWFVDFDPVRRNKDEGGRMKDEISALFPENFQHNEDGLVPLGWHHVSIEQLCEVNGWSLSKSDELQTLEYIEISEVNRGNIGNMVTYTRGDEPSRARRRLRHGDTILSTVRPDRGSYFLALNPPENRVASTGFAVLTPKKAPWSYIYAALTLPEVSDHLGQMADGGAYPAVSPEIIGAMKVAIPNEQEILNAFHQLSAPLFERAEANRNQSLTLATLRDTLLPKLLNGELSVSNLQ